MQAILTSNNREFGSIVRTLNPSEVVFSQEKVQISQLARKNETIAYACVEFILAWGAELISAKTQNFDMIVGTIAGEILQDYYYLSLEEIAHVIKKGAKGEYKKNQVQFTNPYDLPTILEWFKIYDCTERQQIVEKKRINENQEYKSTIINLPENIYEGYHERRKNLVNKKDKQLKDEIEYKKFKAQYILEKLKNQQKNETNQI